MEDSPAFKRKQILAPAITQVNLANMLGEIEQTGGQTLYDCTYVSYLEKTCLKRQKVECQQGSSSLCSLGGSFSWEEEKVLEADGGDAHTAV